MAKVKLVWITPDAEKLIAYCARVSNPKNQNNEKIEGLLNYCIKNKHWSIFEMANMCVEIETSRGISPQILRHKSFSFQEFSLRYSEAIGFEDVKVRRQDEKNRQNSIDDLPKETLYWWEQIKKEINELTEKRYKEALEKGIAKECARFNLPLSTTTRLYMNGNIRSWIHYIELRTGNGTQLEHKEIADIAKEIFKKELPIISKALGW